MAKRTDRYVRKRCQRCGVAAWVRERQRQCHRPRFGRGSYACWGHLETVARRPRPGGVKEVMEYMATMAGEETVYAQVVRAKAAKQLANAKRRAEEAQAALNRAARRLRKWQTIARRTGKRAALADEAILGERQARRDRAAKGGTRAAMRAVVVGSLQ